MKEKLKARKLTREIFVNENGAIDLASIMVGIIVIGIIGGVIAATIFAVIPWSQDNAAKASLDSVKTAESANHGFASESGAAPYVNSDGLSTAGLLAKSSKITVVTGTDGKCYVALSKSDSGNMFYTGSEDQQIQKYTNQTTTCAGVDLPAVVSTITSTGSTTTTTTATGANFSKIDYLSDGVENNAYNSFYAYAAAGGSASTFTPAQFTTLPFAKQYDGQKNADVTKDVTNVYLETADGTKVPFQNDGSVELQTNGSGDVSAITVTTAEEEAFQRQTDTGYTYYNDDDKYIAPGTTSLHFSVDGVDQSLLIKLS